MKQSNVLFIGIALLLTAVSIFIAQDREAGAEFPKKETDFNFSGNAFDFSSEGMVVNDMNIYVDPANVEVTDTLGRKYDYSKLEEPLIVNLKVFQKNGKLHTNTITIIAPLNLSESEETITLEELYERAGQSLQIKEKVKETKKSGTVRDKSKLKKKP